jgi:hypothetical protein
MKMKKMRATGLTILAGGFLVFCQPVLAESTRHQQESTNQVNSLADMLKEAPNEKNPMRTILDAKIIMNHVRVMEVENLQAHPLLDFGRKSSPEARRAYAMDALGTNLYAEIENRFLKTAATTTNAHEKMAAFVMLGQGLTSTNAIGILVKELNANLGKLDDKMEGNQPARDLAFWAAESLCYLGQTNGLGVMSWALETEKMPSAQKIVAIEALVTMQTKEARETLLRSAKQLASSEDDHIAHNSFDVLHQVPEFNEIGISVGEKQLERLQRLCQKRALSKDEWMLLAEVSFFFRGAQERKQLPSEEKKKIKTSAAAIICSGRKEDGDAIDTIPVGRKEESETAAVLFRELSTDDDVEVIKELLKSKYPVVRNAGICCVFQCSQPVRTKMLGDLFPLLDDDNEQNRHLALFVIRIIKGEKGSQSGRFSPEEFKADVNRIKAWWSTEKKNKEQPPIKVGAD